jgi:hypothetical protein
VDDDELLEAAKVTIARAHGLSERDAPRLVGTTAAELHRDAAEMAKEVGALDPTERARDDGGRFRTVGDAVGGDMNARIRAAAGR